MDTLREVETLAIKGARRLNKLFYLGVAVGLVMGVGVLMAAAIPAVTERLEAAGNETWQMLLFGGGMTFLLFVALIEQWNKVRKDRKLMAALGRNPLEIVGIKQETVVESTSRIQFTHVYFKLRDGTQTKVWLPQSDANRLVALLQKGAFIFCPYCISLIHADTVNCSNCGKNVTADAPFEMTLDEYRAEDRKLCQHCGETVLALAFTCPHCKNRL